MGTALALEPQLVPLTRLDNGTYRVTGTRIPLERVVELFLAGETPEGIVEAFDTLRLADVYSIISYYLDHTEEVDKYMRAQQEKGDRIQQMIEAGQPWRAGLRERLLARQACRDKDRDATRD